MRKKFAEKDKAESEATVETKEGEKKDNEKDRGDENTAKLADKSFLDVVTEECQTKANEWDQRSTTRVQELTAISDAMTALAKGGSNYGANKKLAALQKKNATVKLAVHNSNTTTKNTTAKNTTTKRRSFLQLRGSENAPQRVMQLLSKAASRLQSDVLAAAVMKITVSADHFVKVRGLINDLIGRLESQATSEASSKSFCDGAMQKALESRDDANALIEARVGGINVANSKIDGKNSEVLQLSEAIAENLKVLNEATQLRDGDRAENTKTINDAKAGQESIEYAITVLKQFYQDGDANLLQTSYTPPNSDRAGNTFGDLAPKTFSGEYNGAKSSAGGIIGLLDVIMSDFERTEQVTTNQEELDQGAYELIEKDTKEDNEAKRGEIETKEGEIATLKDTVIDLMEDKAGAVDQLTNAKAELSKLKPMCVEGEESYVARVQKREQEITALKEAQTILNDWQS